MSYSIGVTGATKAEALCKLADTFDAVVLGQQPIHEKDRNQALGVAHVFASIAADPAEGQVFSITLNGWVTTNNGVVTGASVGCSAQPTLAPKPAA